MAGSRWRGEQWPILCSACDVQRQGAEQRHERSRDGLAEATMDESAPPELLRLTSRYA